MKNHKVNCQVMFRQVWLPQVMMEQIMKMYGTQFTPKTQNS